MIYRMFTVFIMLMIVGSKLSQFCRASDADALPLAIEVELSNTEKTIISEWLRITFPIPNVDTLAIKDHTEFFLRHTDISEIHEILNNMQQRANALKQSTIDNFLAMNKCECRIPRQLNSYDRILLIDEKMLSSVLSNSDGWKTFYNKYPGVPGVLAFSRPGLDENKTQALLYVSHYVNHLAGNGKLYLLKKTGDNWEIEVTFQVWVS
ncbi:hypothetical protein JW979_14565 [bacterium]|nr:hypothetical protein [candidate division CSSED10-310 bacterium]